MKFSRRIIGLLAIISFNLSPLLHAGDAPLVTAVDVDDLAEGRHHFWLDGGEDGRGGTVRVPVLVLKGKGEGPTLFLSAATHGDELNGIQLVYRLLGDIPSQDLSGAIVAVPGLNPSGILNNSRYFAGSGNGGHQIDLNRIWPGRDSGTTADRFVARLWDGVIAPNADLAIDLHTQTTGTSYPMFVFANFRNRKAREMAFLLAPDVIKNDPGGKGTLESALLEKGVPVVTLELGAPRVFQGGLVERGLAGIRRVMQAEKMLAGFPGTDGLSPPIVGRQYSDVIARSGGFVEMRVGLLDKVFKGDVLARQYDAFGQIREIYKAPESGYILAVATDPLREPGSLIARVIKGQPGRDDR